MAKEEPGQLGLKQECYLPIFPNMKNTYFAILDARSFVYSYLIKPDAYVQTTYIS